MKNLIVILFVLFPVLLQSQTQTENYIKTTTYQVPYNGTTYSNYSYSNAAINLLTSDFVSPGNNTVIGSMQINNNVLTVNFSGSWSPQLMRTGIIKTLDVSPSLPKIELGPILSAGVQTGYFAKIENNNLIVYSPFFFTDMGINTTSNFGYQGVNYSISTGTPYTCGSSGGGHWSGTISMNYNVVTLNVSCGWTAYSCNLKTGQIVQVPSTSNGDLGVIKSSGLDTAYRAKIENGWLVFYATQPVPALPSAGSVNFTVDLGIAKHDQLVNVTYFDGLGRPVQQNAVKQSNSGNDIITHIDYDDFGRQDKEYLPFASSQTTSEYINPATLLPNLVSQYQTNYGVINANPFSQKDFEKSPLNRVLQQAAPGDDWSLAKNHTIKLDYQTNTATEVKLYTVALSFANNTYTPSLSLSTVNGGFYDASQLYKNITKDENWTSGKNDTTEEFKDNQGRVVLKRTYSDYTNTLGVVTATEVPHDTYYVYDDYGNLTYVIPPLVDTSIAITAAVLNDLCYQYKYDYRNRLVEKKLPGKQWEFIVYDKLDRVVATGPAFSPFSDFVSPNNLGWMVTKYDTFNRPVLTAWMPATTVTSTDRQSIQTDRNAESVNFNETKVNLSYTTTINGVVFAYTNVAWPTNSATSVYHILTVNYYDDYNMPTSTPVVAMVLGQPVFYNNTTTKPKGLSTGSWTRVLETSTLFKKETSYTLYDHKARPILNYTTNFLGGSNKVETYLDFSGKTLYTVTTHKRLSNSTAYVIREDFTYTDQNRLLTHTHSINGATPAQLLASNTYDELGQLISKNVGNTAAAPLQKVDYSYNIRGWLKGINNEGSNNATITLGSGDLFGFQINYNDISDVTKQLYNGNISQTLWKTTNADTSTKNYIYTYDALNRLKTATDNLGFYNENLWYDKNGNITFLKRMGAIVGGTTIPDINTPSHFGSMDDLTYTYNAGNQLQTVSDSSNDTYGFNDDFIGSGADTTIDYTYDVNGNMLKDLNKGIGTTTTDGITYNHLNLPTKITFATGSNTGNIVYLYNAAGQKVQKTVNQLTPTVTTTTTYYLGGFQYVNANPTIFKFFPTAEGYVEPNGSSYKYVYQYKDHLGNVRLSYKDVSSTSTPLLQIVEENNYYPFGLKQAGYNGVVNSTNVALKYKYNGKELQDELGLNMYDYGARNYDPALGRWMNIDPLAEKYTSTTPYLYAGNNPILFVDYDGKDYGVYFDSKSGTVTIKATYYTASGSLVSAQQAANAWNSQSGINNYVMGKGDNAVSFKVNYDISVVEVVVDSKLGEMGSLNKALNTDMSGEGNLYTVVADSKLDANTNGTTSGGDYIKVKDSQKSADTGTHEMGHSLGLVHDSKGLMTPASSDPNRSSSVNKSSVSDIIRYPLKGKVNSETDSNGTTVNAGKGTVKNNTPFTNKELKNGKIE